MGVQVMDMQLINELINFVSMHLILWLHSFIKYGRTKSWCYNDKPVWEDIFTAVTKIWYRSEFEVSNEPLKNIFLLDPTIYHNSSNS